MRFMDKEKYKRLKHQSIIREGEAAENKPLLNWQEHCPKCGYDVLCFKPLGGNKRDYTCEDCGYEWHEDLNKKDEFGR